MGLFKEILMDEIRSGRLQVTGMEDVYKNKKNKNNNNKKNKEEHRANVSKLTIKLLNVFNEAEKTSSSKNIDSEGFRQFLADQGFKGGEMTKANFLKAVYQWATHKDFPDKYDDNELAKSFDQIIEYYPKRKAFFSKLIYTEDQKKKITIK